MMNIPKFYYRQQGGEIKSNLDLLIDKMLTLPAYKNYKKEDFLNLIDNVAKVETRDQNIKQIGGGPGRGYFQIETTTLEGAKKRLKNFQDETGLNLNFDYSKNSMDYDRNNQATLALINMHKSARNKGKYLDLNNPMNTWINYHWAGSKDLVPNRQKHWKSIIKE